MRIADSVKGRDLKYKLYTGADLAIDTDKNGNVCLHREVKWEDFRDVTTAWKDLNIVIHTSTLQAGVDYNVLDTFDQFIHVYSGMSSTADQFV